MRWAVSPDHIHALVSVARGQSPFKLVEYIKEMSSRRLQEEFPELRFLRDGRRGG